MTSDVPSATTKYRQAREGIAAWIRDNKLGPGDRLPSVRELMDILSVSYSTLARALSDMREAGQIQQNWGKGIFLREAQTELRNIAVTFNEMVGARHPHLVKLLEGIGAAVSTRQWQIQLFPLPAGTIFGSSGKLLIQELLTERRIQGVIALSPHPPEDIEKLQALGVHTVTVANEYPGMRVSSVVADAAGAAKFLIDHLVRDNGHRHVRLILGPKSSRSARLIRQSTWMEAFIVKELKSNGLRCPPSYILHCDYDWAQIQETLRSWLTGKRRPTALIVADDRLAFSAIEFACMLGLEVPRDLSIVTSSSAEMLAMTSAVLDLPRMGARAVELIEAACRSEPPMNEVVKVSFHPGSTSGVAPDKSILAARREAAMDEKQ